MSASTAWIALALAGLLDVAWAASVKLADGYTRPGWTIVSLVLLGGFVFLLGRATQVLPIGTAYAVWSGIGALGTVAAGVAFFGESLTVPKLLGLTLVGSGLVTLKLASPS